MRNIQNGRTALPITPLPWFARLEVLANDAEVAAPRESGDLVTRLHALLSASPAQRGGIADRTLPGVDHALIAAGGHLSAVLALMPRRAAWMMSACAGGELCMATVLVPGMVEEVTGQGATPALALVAALAMAAAGGAMGLGDGDEDGPAPRFA